MAQAAEVVAAGVVGDDRPTDRRGRPDRRPRGTGTRSAAAAPAPAAARARAAARPRPAAGCAPRRRGRRCAKRRNASRTSGASNRPGIEVAAVDPQAAAGGADQRDQRSATAASRSSTALAPVEQRGASPGVRCRLPRSARRRARSRGGGRSRSPNLRIQRDLAPAALARLLDQRQQQRIADALAAPFAQHRHAADLVFGRQPAGADRRAVERARDDVHAVRVERVPFHLRSGPAVPARTPPRAPRAGRRGRRGSRSASTRNGWRWPAVSCVLASSSSSMQLVVARRRSSSITRIAPGLRQRGVGAPSMPVAAAMRCASRAGRAKFVAADEQPRALAGPAPGHARPRMAQQPRALAAGPIRSRCASGAASRRRDFAGAAVER